MRFHTASLLASAVLVIACGDDSVTGGGPAGGAPTTGGNNTGGEGGGNPIISGGNNTGGEAPAPTKIGAACTTDDDCEASLGGFCISQDVDGFAKGYCSAPCEEDDDCGNGVCISDIQSPFCVLPCGDDTDCRPGYTCQTLTPETSSDACYVGCSLNTDCEAPAECVTEPEQANTGLCVVDEVCDDDGADNDLDNQPDCYDTDCTTVAPCEALISAACTTDAIPLAVGTTTGSTATGSNLFYGPVDGAGCQDGAGVYPGQEVVYTFTPDVTGELEIALTSTSDEDFGMYVRTDCADIASQLACEDRNFGAGNNDEQLLLAVTAGVPLAIFVDAFQVAGGAFSLATTLTEAVCGDGQQTLPEACDDSNILAGDGCSDTCTVELDFYCTNAIPLALDTPTVGNTTSGTNLFQAPQDAIECTFGGAGLAPGQEVIYVYTPAASGMLTIDLTSTSDSDFGLYARTDCLDTVTQLGCSDVNFRPGDNDESLTIPVTVAVPVTIFVDAYQIAGGAFSIELSQN